MNLQDVIQNGNTIAVPNGFFYSAIGPIILLMLAWIAVMLIIISVNHIAKKVTKTGQADGLIIFIGICGFIGSLFLVTYTFDLNRNSYVNKVDEWKTEVAYPYIKTKDTVDLELTSIETNPNLGEGEPNEIIKYRNAEQIVNILEAPEDTRFDQTDKQSAYTLIYDVPTGEKPFVRFYMLDVDLGHGVKPGPYGLDVHLNEKE